MGRFDLTLQQNLHQTGMAASGTAPMQLVGIMTAFDYIIVGAGSAGCVLADKLSADGRHSILLLEAGHRIAVSGCRRQLAMVRPLLTHR